VTNLVHLITKVLLWGELSQPEVSLERKPDINKSEKTTNVFNYGSNEVFRLKFLISLL